MRLVQSALPEGVTLSVNKHEAAVDEIRYVPDTDLKNLETQLGELAISGYKKKGGVIVKQSTRYVRKIARQVQPLNPEEKIYEK